MSTKMKRIKVAPIPVETFFVLNGETIDEEKRLVTGYMDSGEPNNQGFLLDYPTTKPYILKYVESFEQRTDGVSKGAVRVMHQAVVVGKIVDMVLDDENQRVLVTVRVDDDDAWQKVLARNYTGFSGHWNVVGAKWLDKAATAKYGRQILRYTGDPVEVSLVDVPRVPGCEFQKIENGYTEEEMEDALALIASVNDRLGEVKNGVSEGNYLSTLFAELVHLLEYIKQEEAYEGESQRIPDAIREGLLALKPAIQEYVMAQLDELMADEIDYDTAIAELDIEQAESAQNGFVENGDRPGHPFRGNQWKSAAGKASHASKAHAATLRANESGSSAHHASAAKAHAKAAAYHESRGNTKAAAFHARAAKAHGKIAGSVKSGEVESCNNGATAPAQSAVTNITNPGEEKMSPEEIQAITNGFGAAVAEALKPMQESISALAAKIETLPAVAPVANGAPAPAAAPVPAPVALVPVPHDPIMNGVAPVSYDGMSFAEIRATKGA